MTEAEQKPQFESHLTPEAERTSSIALVLDVDGVVTDPVEKKMTDEFRDKNLTHMENLLASGNVVTLNTGRSNEWMIERVINLLKDKLQDKSVLGNFFAVGEKGLTWVSFDSKGDMIQGVFDREGKPVEGFDLSVFLDPETVEHFQALEQKAKELIDSEYYHSTFFDGTKKAMVSTEMQDGFDHKQYSAEQREFTMQLHKIIDDLGLTGKFKVDPTTIATDIQVPEAGKHLGAKRIIDWLTLKGIKPKHYIAVGDSSSDLEMADELKTQGKSYEFVYVQPDKPLPDNVLKDENGQARYNITTTNGKYQQGLNELFERLEVSS